MTMNPDEERAIRWLIRSTKDFVSRKIKDMEYSKTYLHEIDELETAKYYLQLLRRFE